MSSDCIISVLFQSDVCWVDLNVYHLEESLKELAQKFGNISSNRDNIAIYIQTLQDIRYNIVNVKKIDLVSWSSPVLFPQNVF